MSLWTNRLQCIDMVKTEKTPQKKGAWSAEEDRKLSNYIKKYKIWNWSEISKAAGLSRSGKSCRLRWVNYLKPGIKHGSFSNEEVETIMSLHETLGNRWATIASRLPGRTDNEVKNFWHTHLKKRLIKPNPSAGGTALTTESPASKTESNDEASPMAVSQSEQESSKFALKDGDVSVVYDFSVSSSATDFVENRETGHEKRHQTAGDLSVLRPIAGNYEELHVSHGSPATFFEPDSLVGLSADELTWQHESVTWTYEHFYEDVCNDWLDYMDSIF